MGHFYDLFSICITVYLNWFSSLTYCFLRSLSTSIYHKLLFVVFLFDLISFKIHSAYSRISLCKKMCYTEPFKGSRFGYHFKNPLRLKQNCVLSWTSFFCCEKWFQFVLRFLLQEMVSMREKRSICISNRYYRYHRHSIWKLAGVQ